MELLFTWKKSTAYSLFTTEIFTPPRIHHDITYCHNYIGYEVEEADQDKDQGGVYCKGKGQRDGGEHKIGKTQEYEEICGGICTCCGGEEEVPN